MHAKDLTTGEAWLVYRRREGLSIAKAAKELGLSDYEARQLDHDRDAELAASVEIPLDGVLSIAEEFLVDCRREGVSQADAAAAMGITVQWLRRIVKGEGSDEILRKYLAG